VLVVSETGLVYTFTTPKLQPLVTKAEGKNLIQACLNAPEPSSANENGIDGESNVESPEDTHVQVSGARQGMAAPPMPQPYGNMTQEQAMQYQNYLSQHQQPQPGSYPMAAGARMPPQAHAQ